MNAWSELGPLTDNGIRQLLFYQCAHPWLRLGVLFWGAASHKSLVAYIIRPIQAFDQCCFALNPTPALKALQ